MEALFDGTLGSGTLLLLVLSLLIAYLEDRGVLAPADFARCKPGADNFLALLRDGPGLIALLEQLELRFNGDVFQIGRAHV